MSPILLIGIVMAGVPLALIVGFAGFIFISFMNDDKDAKSLFQIALLIMGIGIVLILTHFLGTWIQVT